VGPAVLLPPFAFGFFGAPALGLPSLARLFLWPTALFFQHDARQREHGDDLADLLL
jgi:hypothetical protein